MLWPALMLMQRSKSVIKAISSDGEGTEGGGRVVAAATAHIQGSQSLESGSSPRRSASPAVPLPSANGGARPTTSNRRKDPVRATSGAFGAAVRKARDALNRGSLTSVEYEEAVALAEGLRRQAMEALSCRTSGLDPSTCPPGSLRRERDMLREEIRSPKPRSLTGRVASSLGGKVRSTEGLCDE